MLLTAFTLCLCAMLLCGSAMAEGYNVTTTFPQEMCKLITILRYDEDHNTVEYNTSGSLYHLEAGTEVSLDVEPLTGYVVTEIVSSFTLDDILYTEYLKLEGDNTIRGTFSMPEADVTLTVNMRQEGDVYYPLSAIDRRDGCQSLTLQTAGGQSGEEIEAKAGETVTVVAVPNSGVLVTEMHYTSMFNEYETISFSNDGNGVATGTFVMPAGRINVYVTTATQVYYDYLANTKVVRFNDIDWYVIADHSTGSEPSVTLLSKRPISGYTQYFGQSPFFAKSAVKQYLDNMVTTTFADTAGAIRSVDLPDVKVTGARLYLLSSDELESIPWALRRCEGCNYWLRTPDPGFSAVLSVYGDGGDIVHGNRPSVTSLFVRPALQLDLTRVEFSSSTNTFTPKYVTVTFDSGHEHAEGEMAAASFVINSTSGLPACGYTLDGYEFAGWRIGESDTILEDGEDYTYASDVTLTATWTNAWTRLQALINETENGGDVRLREDATASIYDGPLVIPQGKSITLYLNGCILSRGLTKARENGHVLTNNGTLTIRSGYWGDVGGSITGGRSTGSGGGIVNNGTLNIQRGTVTGNQAAEGGAVFNAVGATLTITGGTLSGNSSTTYSGGAVVNRGTLNISGGTISGNASKMNGAGVWSAGTINLSGGTITGNTTGTGQNGGGIFCSAGTLNLSGAPVVSENNVRNLYLTDNASVQIAGALEPGLRIGLSVQNNPESAGTPKVIADGITGYTGGFVCDSEGYAAFVSTAGELLLTVLPVYGVPDFILPTDITAIEANAFEGAAMTAVSIPDGCGTIGDYAFQDCASLTQIRIPAGCALGTDVFDGCGLVYVFGQAGSPAEAYCQSHGNCVFVAE